MVSVLFPVLLFLAAAVSAPFVTAVEPSFLSAGVVTNTIEIGHSNANKSWTLYAEDSTRTLTININFDQGTFFCNRFVNVYDGPNDHSDFLGHFCANSGPIRSSGRYLFVRLVCLHRHFTVNNININYYQTEAEAEEEGLSGGYISLITIGSIVGIVVVVVVRCIVIGKQEENKSNSFINIFCCNCCN